MCITYQESVINPHVKVYIYKHSPSCVNVVALVVEIPLLLMYFMRMSQLPVD